MKQTFVILFALAVFTGGMHAQGTYSPFGTHTSSSAAFSIEQSGFNSMRMYETTTTTYTPNSLSDIGATGVPSLWHSPALLSDDDDLPPLIGGGEENKPVDPVIGYSPVGDGTWVLIGCAMLFVLFRLVLSKRTKATGKE